MSTKQLLGPKRGAFCKTNEINGLCGGVPKYAAHDNPQIDAEIAKKAHFEPKTSVLIATYSGIRKQIKAVPGPRL